MQTSHMINAIGHFDVAGPDMGALAGFYGGVFGWTVSPAGPRYGRMTTPTVAGALVEAQEASLTLGVIVPDLDRALAEASARGGQVVMPAVDNGWVRKGQVQDPAGNVLTLIQA